jgi:hypothetical protein
VLSSFSALEFCLWAVTALLTVILLSLILIRNQERRFAFFTLYLAVNLLQTALQVYVYRHYGVNSQFSYAATWTSQAVVVVVRAMATGEFCHQVLGKFIGIWALAIRVLLVCSGSVLALALYFGKDGMRYGVVTLEIGMETFVATMVAGTFVFARYYDLKAERSAMLLGLGLCLNSCFKILNDLVLSRYFAVYQNRWNTSSMITFVCVLMVWTWAIRAAAATAPAPAPKLQPAQIYRTWIPGINERLLQLNDQLIRLWKLEPPEP